MDFDPACIGEPRSKQQMLHQIHSIQSQHARRGKAATKTRYGIKDMPSALLELPLDLHRYEVVQCIETPCSCTSHVWVLESTQCLLQ